MGITDREGTHHHNNHDHGAIKLDGSGGNDERGKRREEEKRGKREDGEERKGEDIGDGKRRGGRG